MTFYSNIPIHRRPARSHFSHHEWTMALASCPTKAHGKVGKNHNAEQLSIKAVALSGHGLANAKRSLSFS